MIEVKNLLKGLVCTSMILRERLALYSSTNVETEAPRSEEFVKGRITSEWQDWNSNAGVPDSRVHIFYHFRILLP